MATFCRIDSRRYRLAFAQNLPGIVPPVTTWWEFARSRAMAALNAAKPKPRGRPKRRPKGGGACGVPHTNLGAIMMMAIAVLAIVMLILKKSTPVSVSEFST